MLKGVRKLSVKQYEVWQGNNHIYCDGEIITGPERLFFWSTSLAIAVPLCLFLFRVCYPLIDRSPFFMLGGVAFLILIHSTHFLCSFCDPGILPRELTSCDFPNSETREANLDGQVVIETYCRTCHIWRPPRAHHCSICNNCIAGFDHHCPWMGNCIGARNYRRFLLFLCVTSGGCIYVSTVSIYKNFIVHGEWNPNEIFMADIWASCITIYSFVVLLGVGPFTLYHCYLIGIGRTTYEAVKVIDTAEWNRGCLKNFFYYICRTVPPSLLNLRGPLVCEATSGSSVIP